MKKIYQFNKNGELLNCYKSIAEASRIVGVTKETLSAVCNGKRKSAVGSFWSFKDTVDKTKEDEEVWKDIKGFEGQYQMSENREVRRIPFSILQKDVDGNVYVRNFTGGKIKQCIDCEGYLSVCLCGKKYRIHWLYYNTFIGDSSGFVIDHKDRNKLNNDPSNLRLLTQEQNAHNCTMRYAPDITDISKYQKYSNKMKAHPFCLRFTEDKKRRIIGYFNTYEEAENKYRELYNQRQKRIDDSSKILTISS